MASWLIDNANTRYVLFGMVGCLHWRRLVAASPTEHTLLVGVAAAVGLIALLWVLTQVVVTDRQQLELNVRGMADAVVEARPMRCSNSSPTTLNFRGVKRTPELDLAHTMVFLGKSAIARSGVRHRHFRVSTSKTLKRCPAKVFFRATVHNRCRDDRPYLVALQSCIRQGREGQWRLKRSARFPIIRSVNQRSTDHRC